VFASHVLAIGPNDTAESVEHRLAAAGADLLLRVVEEIDSGRARETPQDDRLATYAPRLIKEEGLICWDEPAPAIHNKVRGLHPWPHAYTFLDGARFIILESAVGSRDPADGRRGDRPWRPGEIVEAGHGSLMVAGGGGTVLSILRIQPEGRRPMAVGEFLAGHPLSPGQTFGPA
jgi:methionyl-tRNA formyltransferase